MAHDFEDHELSESSSFLPYSDFVHPCDGKFKRLHGIWKVLQIFFWLFTVVINLSAMVVLSHFINGRPDFGGEVNNITPKCEYYITPRYSCLYNRTRADSRSARTNLKMMKLG